MQCVHSQSYNSSMVYTTLSGTVVTSPQMPGWIHAVWEWEVTATRIVGLFIPDSQLGFPPFLKWAHMYCTCIYCIHVWPEHGLSYTNCWHACNLFVMGVLPWRNGLITAMANRSNWMGVKFGWPSCRKRSLRNEYTRCFCSRHKTWCNLALEFVRNKRVALLCHTIL